MRVDASEPPPPLDPITPPTDHPSDLAEAAVAEPGAAVTGEVSEAARSALAESEGGFLVATMGELRKVVWPSRQQLFSESVAVILMVSLSAATIAAIDRFYHWLSSQVFR
jgi:preprotein translocase subunit SecE